MIKGNMLSLFSRGGKAPYAPTMLGSITGDPNDNLYRESNEIVSEFNKEWDSTLAGNGQPQTAKSVRTNIPFILMLDDIISRKGTMKYVKVADGHFAAEHEVKGGYLVCEYEIKGRLRASLVEKDNSDGTLKYKPLPNVAECDKRAIWGCILLAQLDAGFPQINPTTYPVAHSIANAIGEAILTQTVEKKEFWWQAPTLFFDACCYPTKAKGASIFEIEEDSFDEGNFTQIEEERLDSKALCGVLVYGEDPQILTNNGSSATVIRGTLGEFAEMEIVKAFREAQLSRLTEEEKELIPNPLTDKDVDDNALLVPETRQLCMHYLKTTATGRPMRNFAWIGITGYGKSTGCRQAARLLGLPYVVESCSDDTTIDDILTRYVPKTSKMGQEKIAESKMPNELPTFEEIEKSPAVAYKKLTGEDNPFAIPTDCFKKLFDLSKSPRFQFVLAKQEAKEKRDKAYAEAEGKRETILSNPYTTDFSIAFTEEKRGKQLADEIYHEAMSKIMAEEIKLAEEKTDDSGFVMVEAPYSRALRHGWLCEVQESSRIRKQAVLVGLNEYSRIGSKVVMADGTTFARDEKALVVFTDNVGYDTCRSTDPSVIRRWDEVLTTPELDKDFVLARIKANCPEVKDSGLDLDLMYKTYTETLEYCKKRQMTDGSCTIVELENWVRLAIIEGATKKALRETFKTALVNKCSLLPEEQEDIFKAIKATTKLL